MQMRHAVGVLGLTVGIITNPMPSAAGRVEPSQKGAMLMSARDRNVKVMLDLFRAIEERDPNHRNVERELGFYQPDVEFHWPPALPYGGTFRGLTQRGGGDWSATWNALQPSAAERAMDPRVIGASDHEVVILYHQRGVSPSGERFDGEVIGLYELRDFKLSRAQMFYFDEAAAARFLDHAAVATSQRKR